MLRLRIALSPLISVGLLISSLPTVVAVETRMVDVASITWSGANSKVGVLDVENSIKTEVGPRWKRYTSVEGSKEDKSITFQHGLTLAAPISLTRRMQCEGSSASSSMNSIRQEAYKRLGIERYAERYLVILTPDAGCIWTGRALIGNVKNPGGVMMLQDSASAFVIVHELGHALGLGHSNFLRCDSGKNDGPWGSDCKAVEYGGAIDVMSNVDVDIPLSTYSQWLMGYLDKTEVKQSWLNEKIVLSAMDVYGGTRAIFLRDGKSTYWIEYRRANGNVSYKPGLVIYRTDPPPISAVVSPNPEDALSPEFDEDVTADIWMLNWDNYTYSRSRANGSMTLPSGKTATVFSGNISITAKATQDPNKVEVSIVRKADVTPPPAPELVDLNFWRYPGVSILRSGYDDGETAIASFEADISGKVIPLAASEIDGFSPTYLNPFSPPKTVYLRDLPEGDYNLAIRAIDVWGNRSPWSKSVKTYVDRGSPTVGKEFSLASIDSRTTSFVWTGVRDEGIGLCTTLIHNPEGFVLTRSNEKSNPRLTFATGKKTVATAQVFDCLGNGLSGEITVSSGLVSATNSKRTGKWSPAPSVYGAGALKCDGKCTASISISGSVHALIGEGSATISVTGKPVVKMGVSSTRSIRFSDALAVGPRNRVVRVTGNNFVFGGLAKFEKTISEFKPIVQNPEISDPSLADPIQVEMARLGFNSGDFIGGWTVLPMARGTTLLDPTLDLCAADYQSESGREVRRQVSVAKVGSPYLFLSTEAVKYRSAAAAASALSELKKNYELCMKSKGGVENGILTPYVFQTLPKSSAQLVDEENRVVVRAAIGSGNSARQLLAIYQYRGEFFTGLYVVLSGEKSIPDDEVLRWYDIAEIMATRLNTK